MIIKHFYAGTADDRTRATIQSITFSPDEPKKGDDLTIEAKFTLSKLLITCCYSIVAPAMASK